MAAASIFIDANAYLDFYRVATMKHVLPLVLAVRERICLPQQVADEVHRNKLRVMLDGWASSLLQAQKLSLPSVGLFSKSVPDILLPVEVREGLATDTDRLRELIDKAKGLGKNIAAQVNAAVEQLASEISRSEDDVSRELEPLWASARPATPAELERARRRRECGNPPGKRSDTLGDQLNWEQFLANVNSTDAVWIISRDGDYFERVGDKRVLNPLLMRDLRARLGSAPVVHDFETIERGLKHFSESRHTAEDKRPTDAQVREIESERARVQQTTALRQDEEYVGEFELIYDSIPPGAKVYECDSRFTHLPDDEAEWPEYMEREGWYVGVTPVRKTQMANPGGPGAFIIFVLDGKAKRAEFPEPTGPVAFVHVDFQ